MTDQDKVLNAIGDPAMAKILSQILEQIDGEPLAAARMIRAFQGAFSIINETTKALPAAWNELEGHLTNADLKRAQFTQDLRDFRQNTMGELKAAVEDLKVLEAFFAKLDDNEFLNKSNRILELFDKLTKAKRDGTLEWISKLSTK